MIQEELWREVEGFDDYRVSNLGRIVHVDRPTLARKTNVNHQGFPTLVLYTKDHPGARYLRQVNQLVAKAFIGPPGPKQDAVWHIDGDPLNCQADNLRWDMRARVMEWNEMHKDPKPKYKTGRVMINSTGRTFANAFELALFVGDIETAIVSHIEKYPPQYADRARYQYID